ncbi:hypothetical protein HPB51_028745 [Rhipicephalus microplus]|uniref:Uncharacterized protein n=1 Tax=Rhipicephalus microplus TaxID=6941 RepID=A0A9J6CWM7_RHIMP|nr:hypothetical protein HPB51_028745 [Rhipicephalus microplus]
MRNTIHNTPRGIAPLLNGGLRGVVWADCLQAVLTISAPVVIVAKVMWDAKSGDTRIQPLSEILTYKYLFKTVINGTLMTCVFYGLLACAGAALVCRYRGCDPVLSGSIKKFDQSGRWCRVKIQTSSYIRVPPGAALVSSTITRPQREPPMFVGLRSDDVED